MAVKLPIEVQLQVQESTRLRKWPSKALEKLTHPVHLARPWTGSSGCQKERVKERVEAEAA
jgi:hypothetical protein